MNTKQVIIIRKDLKMRKGKMVAQGAHASMKVILDMGEYETHEIGLPTLTIPMQPDVHNWLTGIFTKICVGIDSEESLLVIYNKAKELGVPCSLIQDAGLTEFDGVPTYTAVAVGPGDVDIINGLTGHLKLL